MRMVHRGFSISAVDVLGVVTYFCLREGTSQEIMMLKLLEPLLRAFRLPSIDDAERDYLNGAHDRVNLEYRQRQVDQGLFRHAHKM